MMRFFKFLSAFTLLLSTLSVFSQAVVSRQDIEPSRSVIYPYNSDTLLVNNDIYSSLYVNKVDGWQRSKASDTLFVNTFVSPFEWINREVFVRVEHADAPYSLEVNGELLAAVESGNMPVEFNVTNLARAGQNSVAIRLSPNSESRRLEGWRKSNSLIDNPIGGVEVISRSKLSVREVLCSTRVVGDVLSAQIGFVLKSYNLNEREVVLRSRLKDSAGEIISTSLDSVRLRHRGEDTVYLSTNISRDLSWSAEVPTHNILEIDLREDNRLMELFHIPIALRELSVDEGGEVRINGDVVKLRAKRIDQKLTRNELINIRDSGVNLLIISAGVEPLEMLEICDEVGLFAVVTAPINSCKSGATIEVGGNITNDPKWCERYISRLEQSYYPILRHPSVVGFNLADSSMNGYNLYEGYLYLKRLGGDIPILNLDGGGEWNGDKLKFEVVK